MEQVRELSEVALQRASGELANFVGQLRSLMVVAAALQEAGGIERRLPALRQEAEQTVTAAQTQANALVAAAHAEDGALRRDSAALQAARDRLRAEAVTAQEELRRVNAELASRRKDLGEIERRINDIKTRLSG